MRSSASEPEDACPDCGGVLRHAAGETLYDGVIQWFVESSCPDCGAELVGCGRGLAPVGTRGHLIALTGLWVGDR